MAAAAYRTLGATVAFAFAGQGLAAAVFVPQKIQRQNERFYDLMGSAGFLSATAFSLYFPALRERFWLHNRHAVFPTSFHPRQIMLSSLTALWAGRLGTFLFQRISKHGKDSRFDEIKKNPVSFTGAWMAQATWISLTALPVFAVNAIPMRLQPSLGIRDAIGLALWISAFAFEVIADRQKSKWREQRDKKEHDEKFITSGLWSLSRHPNYVGEVSMWASIWVIAASALSRSGVYPAYFTWLALVSPIAEYLLITKVSGVPLLEKSGDEKYGKDPEWQKYKQNVPVFWPKLF